MLDSHTATPYSEGMKTVKTIRDRLGLSQSELAQVLGVKPTTISTYENGRAEISREKAQVLIDAAKVRGLLIDFNHLYGDVELPPERAPRAPAQAAQAGG